MFSGTFTAMVTPFKDGRVDEAAFKKLIRFGIDGGVTGFLPCGTTGESPALSHEEHNRVIELTVKEVAGQVKVLAGTGSNSTEEAIALTRHAKAVGADAALMVSPYYNKPTQEGLYLHFKAVAEAVDIPILVYNIQGRTAVNIENQTMERLAGISNIVGRRGLRFDYADERGDSALRLGVRRSVRRRPDDVSPYGARRKGCYLCRHQYCARKDVLAGEHYVGRGNRQGSSYAL
jgi:hypothetical protein